VEISTLRALARSEELFGHIPAGQLPADTTRAEPPQRGERRVTVRLPGSAPMVRIAYHTPAAAHPDFVPLVIADAVLSGGKAMFAFGDSTSRRRASTAPWWSRAWPLGGLQL
jgi:zinc protease